MNTKSFSSIFSSIFLLLSACATIPPISDNLNRPPLIPTRNDAIKIAVLDLGTTHMKKSFMFANGGDERVAIPILGGLILHPKGNILVDTGFHHSLYDGTPRDHYVPYALFAAMTKGNGLTIRAGQDTRTHIAGNLPGLEIAKVVITHLHLDHAGDLGRYPNAQIVTAEDEFSDAMDISPIFRGYYRPDYAGLTNIVPLKRADARPIGSTGLTGYDLTGDGSIIAVNTPGHTLGHLGVLVSGAKTVFFAGDAIYQLENLSTPKGSQYGRDADYNKDAGKLTVAAIQRLSASIPDLVIIPAHGAKVLLEHAPFPQWLQ